MGSDGLFDNLFDKDIIECLLLNLNIKKSKNLDKLEILNLQNTSNCLALKAEIMGYDKNYDSPFTIEARANKKKHRGGKADDITVIVG